MYTVQDGRHFPRGSSGSVPVPSLSARYLAGTTDVSLSTPARYIISSFQSLKVCVSLVLTAVDKQSTKQTCLASTKLLGRHMALPTTVWGP